MKKILLIVLLSNLICKAQSNFEISYKFIDKDNHITNSILFINNNESVYKIYDDRETGLDESKTKDNTYVTVQNDKISKIFYSTSKNTITRIPLYNSEIVYSDLNNKIKYKLTGKQKVINKYNCQEAKFDLNGRKYSVWFTSKIEINYGPYKINGLPGLIVELNEETNKIKISLVSIKKLTDKTEFNSLKKYLTDKKHLSYPDYEKKIISIMTTKKKKSYAEMAELGVSVKYDESQGAFTKFLIDIPTNLVSELKKVKG